MEREFVTERGPKHEFYSDLKGTWPDLVSWRLDIIRVERDFGAERD